MEGWVRARTPEQIGRRRRQILEAARGLFLRDGYERVSLNQIGRAAGMAKANIYKYFMSREEVYLSLYHSLFATWRDMFVAKLQAHRVTRVEDLASLLADHTVVHLSFLSLNSVLASSLLPNSSRATRDEYERMIAESVTRLREALRAEFAWFDEGRVAELLAVLQSYAAGRWLVLQRPVGGAGATAAAQAGLRTELRRLLTHVLGSQQRENVAAVL